MDYNIQDYLNHNRCESFNRLLFSYIDKGGYKDSDVYKKANIDRKLFSKIRCNENYIPRKNVVIKLCLALLLDKKDFMSLLNSAGYSLTNNNDTDLIVSYFVEKKVYDLSTINDYLYAYSGTIL